jgi:hypothetical protein
MWNKFVLLDITIQTTIVIYSALLDILDIMNTLGLDE